MATDGAMLDDHAVSALDPIHGRETAGNAELIERLAGPEARNLAALALQNGASIHELLHQGGTRHWPLEIRRVLDAATTLVRRADRGRPTPPRFEGPKRIAQYVWRRHLPAGVEHFGALLLDGRNRLLRETIVGVGTTTMAPIDKKALARQLASVPTCRLATWHNHPNVADRTMLRCSRTAFPCNEAIALTAT